LFGIESYTRSKAEAGAEVASVAGQSITQQELEIAVRNKADSLRQAYGPQFDPKMLNTPEAREPFWMRFLPSAQSPLKCRKNASSFLTVFWRMTI
jgi:hypothetical protein